MLYHLTICHQQLPTGFMHSYIIKVKVHHVVSVPSRAYSQYITGDLSPLYHITCIRASWISINTWPCFRHWNVWAPQLAHHHSSTTPYPILPSPFSSLVHCSPLNIQASQQPASRSQGVWSPARPLPLPTIWASILYVKCITCGVWPEGIWRWS